MRSTRRKNPFVKLRARAPYRADGKTTLSGIAGKAGVYIIRENGKIVYVGYSATNIYRTMYRHFQKWNHSQQEVVTYESRMKANKYSVQVTICSPGKAEKLERALVKKHEPRDNSNKYEQYKLKLDDTKLVNDWIEQTTEESPF